MKSITFHCETITPMFLAGADGKTPELRPPSIKGAMRFWWRALNGHLTLAEMKKKESEIFGGGGTKARRSSFSIDIINKQKIDTKQISLTPHHRKGYCSSTNNNCYNYNNSTKECVKAKKQQGVFWEFDLKILYNESIISKNELISLIKTTFLLGGFGKRSRRGFGSIKLEDKYNLLSLEQVNDFISKLRYTTNTNYPTINNITVGETAYSSYEDLLIKIGELTHSESFMFNKYIDGNKIKRYSAPSLVSIIKNGNGYYPIITSLTYKNENFKYQNFKQFEHKILK